MPKEQNKSKGARNRTADVDASLARPGGLSYLEIPVTDARQSAIFYQKVCGWKIEERAADDWRFADPSGHLIGSWKIGRAISRRPGLLPFIYVNGIRKAVEQVAKYGGEVVKAPYPEGNLLVAVVRDPAGNVIGLWEVAPHH